MARLTPIKAIRQHCIACNCGNKAEVRRCVIPDCALYPYRLGHNPYIKRGLADNGQSPDSSDGSEAVLENADGEE